MFTRRHFERVAEVIRKMPNKPMTRSQIADVFCRVFKQENPQFKEQKFLVKCLNLEEDV
jgi:hypothetical protein